MLITKYLRMRKHLQNQWLPTDKLTEMQNSNLRKLINHAYYKVPYYRNLFRTVGLKPTDIQTVNDLNKIPLTSKERINKLPINELVAEGTNLSSCIHGKTSGSTGIPLQIILTTSDLEHHQALWNSFLDTCGRKIRDKILIITGRFPKIYKKKWYQYIGIGETSFLLTKEDAESLVNGIRKVKPDIIVCYPSRMVVVAQAVRKQGIEKIAPRILITTAETLDIETREYINKTFNVKLIDYYGSWETGMIAWECSKHEGYHAILDSVVLEVVKNNENVKPGESGEIVVTNLISYTMPFIRYTLGDIGVYMGKMCSCGRGFPLLLERIEGRSDELIVLPSGKFLSPNAFDVPIKYVNGIEKFQIIQEDVHNISVLLVIAHRNSDEIVKSVEQKLREHVPDSVNLNIKLVDEVPMAESGKQKCVISKVKVQLNQS